MFALIQCHFIESSPLARTKSLIKQIENLDNEVKTAFVPADFFASVNEMPYGKSPRSASAIIYAEEKDRCIELIQEAIPAHLALVFYEEKNIVIIKKDEIEKHTLNATKTSIEIQTRAFTFSYNALPDMSILNTSADYHIHYNKCPFYYGMQEANIHIFQEFAKSLSRKFIFLNPVYAFGGEVFHGQSFIVNGRGEIEQCARCFEEDVLSIGNSEKEPLYDDKNRLIFDAIVFAIKEHVHNANLQKAVIGLSGGIDSAMVACLGVEALGKENVVGLLMPSPNSSDHSVADAQKLAENLGIKYHILKIDETMQAYANLLNPLAQIHEESKEHTALMEQNLQSRIRGMLLMGLANTSSAFLLGTGNKSEASMGYCTLYGDTCAGLFPIGDLYKTEVYNLAKWYNATSEKEIIPENSILKAPSAELAPNQKDSDSLPEYAELDTYLHKMLEEKARAFDIEHVFTQNERKNILNKMKNAEFKRQQCAPAVKLSHASYGVEWK